MMFLDYLKAIAWPVFGLILLVSFWRPLHEIASVLPGLLSSAESITISKVAIKMPRSVVDHIPQEVRTVLAKLEPIDINNILAQPYAGYVWVSDEWNASLWRRLVGFGLVSELPAAGVQEYNKKQNVNAKAVFQMNPLFTDTRDSLVRLTTELISEAKVSVEAERKSKAIK